MVTLPETNSSHLKIGRLPLKREGFEVWSINFHLRFCSFQGGYYHHTLKIRFKPWFPNILWAGHPPSFHNHSTTRPSGARCVTSVEAYALVGTGAGEVTFEIFLERGHPRKAWDLFWFTEVDFLCFGTYSWVAMFWKQEKYIKKWFLRVSHVLCFVKAWAVLEGSLVLNVLVFLNELGAGREFQGWCGLESLQHSAKSVQMIGLDLMIWFVCSWFFSGGRGWCFLFLLFNSWREKRVFDWTPVYAL